MNINDLRNKIMPLITNNCREAIIKVAYDMFAEYEQSNKSEGEPELKQTGFEGKLNANSFKNMKQLVDALVKDNIIVFNNQSSTDRAIESMTKEIEHIKDIAKNALINHDDVFLQINEMRKENKQVLTNDFLLELIKGIKKEIFEQYAYTKKYIACIDECRAEIETLKKQVADLKQRLKAVDVPEPKQERYIASGNYILKLDDNGKCYNSIRDEVDIRNICRILNSLEASKND